MDDKDIAGALLADGGILDKDDIPNENQALECFSCGATVSGVYCSNCGQKNDDYRRSILRLFGELIGSFTALESRIWRTWAALLFKPGKVAREFADGARVKWSSPIRVFLAISILLFGFLGITGTQLVSIDINVLPKKGITKPHSDLTDKDLRMTGAMRFFVSQKEIDKANEQRNFDLIEKWLKGNNGFYFDVDENTVNTGMGTNTAETKSEKTSDTGNSSEVDELKKPLAQVKNDVLTELTPEQKEKLKIAQEQARDVTDRLSPNRMSKLFLQIVRNPGLVNGIIYKWLPRIMFLMMPITMFIGILFIRGRGNALLYDHLVHAAYIHSVAFFLLFLGVLLMYILPGALVAKTLMVILLIYLPLSLRGMFHRGWIKSIWASYGVGFIYLLIVSTVATGIVSYQVWKLAETIV